MSIADCGITTDARGRETVQHGTTLFPAAFYEDDVQKPFIPWHWHEEFECIVATAGSFEVCLEGSRFLLHAGEGIFINSEALHTVEPGDGACSMLHSVVFHPRLIGGSMDSVFWHELVKPLLQDGAFRYLLLSPRIPWQKEILLGIQEAWQAGVEEPEDYENFVRYRLSAVFRRINAHHPTLRCRRQQQDHISAERMKTMLRFIEEHYAEELPVERIAGSISVSGSVCLRCFRQMLGTTPTQYVKHFRIEKAAQLLLTTDRKINAIGMECGFSDLSYFTKTFREEKGYPPKEYRAAFRQGH